MTDRELIHMTPRIAALPKDKRGYPVPKFVTWIDGEPDFRIVDSRHLVDCVRHDKCWICGETMGTHKAFVIGPMCCINRISAEPPMHRDCAIFSTHNCPFLTRPLAKRSLKELPEGTTAPAGTMIERNPGVTCMWITKSYKPFKAGNGTLFDIGEPLEISFFSQGKPATREEINHSVKTGLPILTNEAMKDGKAGLKALDESYARFINLLETTETAEQV